MFDAFVSGISSATQPILLLIMLGGVLIGLFVGILPGLGGAATIALLLPFIWGKDPTMSMAFLVAIQAVVFTGGAVTSILLNIPGETGNMATLLDGYPMNKKGEGARAIGAAIFSSMCGGILAVLFAFGMIPIIGKVVLGFRSPEIFLLVVLGISFIAVLTGRSVVKGLIAGGMGILLSMIGFQSLTGVARFTLGSTFLYDHIHLPVFVMGFFGLPEMWELLAGGQATIGSREIGRLSLRDTLTGIKDVGRHWALALRCSILGYIVGVIPGIGAGTAMWVAYGHAKQTSERPQEFGTGCVEGVIGPQSADNAISSGAMLTAMTFGIPGSLTTAIMLGGFMLVGIVPGPIMVSQNLPLIFALLTGIAIANVMSGAITLSLASYLGRIAFIHLDFIFPTVVSVMLVAAVVNQGLLLDVVVFILSGLLGMAMSRFGYSRPALALGFVLGGLFEYYLFMSLKLHGSLFFLKPSCLALLAILVALFFYQPLSKFLKGLLRKGKAGTGAGR